MTSVNEGPYSTIMCYRYNDDCDMMRTSNIQTTIDYNLDQFMIMMCLCISLLYRHALHSSEFYLESLRHPLNPLTSLDIDIDFLYRLPDDSPAKSSKTAGILPKDDSFIRFVGDGVHP